MLTMLGGLCVLVFAAPVETFDPGFMYGTLRIGDMVSTVCAEARVAGVPREGALVVSVRHMNASSQKYTRSFVIFCKTDAQAEGNTWGPGEWKEMVGSDRFKVSGTTVTEVHGVRRQLFILEQIKP